MHSRLSGLVFDDFMKEIQKLLNRQKFDEVKKLLHDYEKVRPDKLFKDGMCFFKSGLYRDAISNYKELYELKHDARALIGIGRSYYELGEYTKAIATFRLIPSWEKNKLAIFNSALAHERNGEDADALKLYKLVTRLFPQFYLGHLNLCRYAVEHNYKYANFILKVGLDKFDSPELMQLKFQFNEQQEQLKNRICDFSLFKYTPVPGKRELYPRYSDIYVKNKKEFRHLEALDLSLPVGYKGLV